MLTKKSVPHPSFIVQKWSVTVHRTFRLWLSCFQWVKWARLCQKSAAGDVGVKAVSKIKSQWFLSKAQINPRTPLRCPARRCCADAANQQGLTVPLWPQRRESDKCCGYFHNPFGALDFNRRKKNSCLKEGKRLPGNESYFLNRRKGFWADHSISITH